MTPLDLETLETEIGAPESGEAAETKRIRELLAARRFDYATEPPPIVPVYTLAGTTISTAGNLTAITAHAKVGKSALLGAAMASVICPSACDTLTISSSNPNGAALVHIDTEQSQEDHWRHNARTLRRAGVTEPPPWFHSVY